MSSSYDCYVIDTKGRKQRLNRRASDLPSLASSLRSEGFALIKAETAKAGGKSKLKLDQVLAFTQNLELLLQEDFTLMEAFRILSSTSQGRLDGLIQYVTGQLELGASLGKALEAWASSFPGLYLGLIKIGEATANLKPVLKQLSRYMQKRKELRDRILSALAYPLLVIGVLFVGMILISIFLLPTMIEIASTMQNSNISAQSLQQKMLASQIGLVLLFALFPLAYGFLRFAARRPKLKLSIDTLTLTRRPFNSFLLPLTLQNLSFSLATLIDSGYPIDQALEECTNLSANLAVKKALRQIHEKAEKGMGLPRAFRESEIFPPTFCTWLQVGVEAQSLGPVFMRLQEYYEAQFTKVTARFMTLFEPAMIVGIGGIVILFFFQFVAPIFSIVNGGF